jgi:hypothetical protein
MLGIHVVFVVPAREHDVVFAGQAPAQMSSQEAGATSNQNSLFHLPTKLHALPQ